MLYQSTHQSLQQFFIETFKLIEVYALICCHISKGFTQSLICQRIFKIIRYWSNKPTDIIKDIFSRSSIKPYTCLNKALANDFRGASEVGVEGSSRSANLRSLSRGVGMPTKGFSIISYSTFGIATASVIHGFPHRTACCAPFNRRLDRLIFLL